MELNLAHAADSLFKGFRLRSLLKQAPLVVAFWLAMHSGEVLADDIVPFAEMSAEIRR